MTNFYKKKKGKNIKISYMLQKIAQKSKILLNIQKYVNYNFKF